MPGLSDLTKKIQEIKQEGRLFDYICISKEDFDALVKELAPLTPYGKASGQNCNSLGLNEIPVVIRGTARDLSMYLCGKKALDI